MIKMIRHTECPMRDKIEDKFIIRGYGRGCSQDIQCDICERFKFYILTTRLSIAEVDDYEDFLIDKLKETNADAPPEIIKKIEFELGCIDREKISRQKLAEKHGLENYDAYLYKKKNASMKDNRECGLFLGCHIAERLLSNIFKRVERLPYNHKGYDFVCDKGFKVDVKASCITKQGFQFTINKNKEPDYFLLIAFDNRQELNPLGIWLIKSDAIIRNRRLNKFHTLSIINRSDKLIILKDYEQTDKLDELLNCCADIKNGKQCRIETN